MIPYGKQWIDEDDVSAVVSVLRSDWLTTGPKVVEFEQALAEYCGAKHAVAVANGTVALHVAMLAAGIKVGDRVLTSANTFLASANCAEVVGATVDFADIDPMTYNVTADTLEAGWKADVRAIVPVDVAGQPCYLPAIAALARARGTIIVEDASHALGSQFQYQGKWYKVGGHPWADMTTLSFHPVKTITTGEGGAILTNNDRLAERCRLLRNHGMMRPENGNRKSDLQGGDSSATTQVSGLSPQPSEYGPWYYEMQEIGYNYRLTDLQCALGLSQLKKLDRFIARRQEIVASYSAAFSSLPNVVVPQLPDRLTQASGVILHPSKIAWHLYVLRIDFEAIGKTRSRIMTELKDRGVGTQVHYIPVHLQPYYRRKYGYGPGKCPAAEAYYRQCLSLPLFPAMSDVDVQQVIGALTEVIEVSRR